MVVSQKKVYFCVKLGLQSETIQGAGGALPVAAGYLAENYKVCNTLLLPVVNPVLGCWKY